MIVITLDDIMSLISIVLGVILCIMAYSDLFTKKKRGTK